MAVRFQIRRSTASEWTDANPVLLDGELAVERDTQKWKIGNGVTAWNDLPYAPQGIQGIQGEPGIQGIPGEKGADGITPSITHLETAVYTLITDVVGDESTRNSNESIRESQEEARVTEEGKRALAEEGRVDAEILREKRVTDIEALSVRAIDKSVSLLGHTNPIS